MNNYYNGTETLAPNPSFPSETMISIMHSPSAKAGDVGLIPGSGRSPGEGNGNPLQYSCLGNPMVRGA